MARNTWTVYIEESGPVWTLDSTIYIPNDTMELGLVSNQQKVMLIDGSDAFIAPDVKYQRSQFVFQWTYVEEAFVEQIQDYIKNYDYIKIVTHLGSRIFIGRFVSCEPAWLVGQEDLFDLTATFEQMDAIA